MASLAGPTSSVKLASASAPRESWSGSLETGRNPSAVTLIE